MTVRGMPAAPETTAVVPTIGRSPWLAACLQALRRQADAATLEIVVVDQAPRPLALPPGLADRVLRPERNLGFAGGTNLGLAAARGEYLATVNDDAVVGPGWLAALTAALRADPRAAAAQGINILADAAGMEDDGTQGGSGESPGGQPVEHEPRQTVRDGGGAMPDGQLIEHEQARIDGCGLGWNRWWQAIQIGHGEPLAAAADVFGLPGRPPSSGAVSVTEIFGVSATAALFRRTALAQVALDGQVFDQRLVSYYEDAELAGRLRAAGFSALLVPAARARHAGSASGRTAPSSHERWRLIYGNRYLAAARLLGRGFWPRLPLMLLRDLLDMAGPAALLQACRGGHQLVPGERSAGPGARERLAGMAIGWGSALRQMPAFARRGAPAPAPAEIARLRHLSVRPRPKGREKDREED
jgi:GT2 family glycosyltransferase